MHEQAAARFSSWLLVFILVLFMSLFYVKAATEMQLDHDHEQNRPWTEEDMDEDGVSSIIQRRHVSVKKNCDLSTGKWVYDTSYPLYERTCPYLSTPVSCQRNGRPDADYEKWKWKPHGCSVPRFHALDFLGRMRRKRIMLVGDSIVRNQWESLVCLIEGVIPPKRKMVVYNGPTMAFHALDFDISIEFSWAPFLVEVKEGAQNERFVHLDKIEENAKFWRGVDVLIFDSAHWWSHAGKWNSWDFYIEGQNVVNNLNPMVAYEIGLTTWAKWVDLNLNPQTTRVIFRSISPRHNRQNGWKCYKQTKPALEYFMSHQLHIPEQLLVLQKVLKKMYFPVYLQDITKMSALRRDGHPSVYSRVSGKQNRLLHPEDSFSDCSHWCLPGVPDIWNEMLNSILMTKV